MERKKFVELVEKEFLWLIDLGYEFNHIEQGISFIKSAEKEAFKIYFSWAEYNEYCIYGINCAKRFNSIENLIEKSTGNFDFTIFKGHQGIIPNELESLKDDYHLNSFYIAQYSQISIFSQMVRDFYNNEVLAFYDNFKSLKDILFWLSNNDIKEHSKLLVNSQNCMMLRKLIIMKKENSIEFDNLYGRYKSYLHQKFNKNESPYSKMYLDFIKFDTYFMS